MDIELLWQEHRDARFPAGLRGRDINGIDFVMLDADIAGCIGTFLHRRGTLDLARTATLGLSLGNAERVIHQLTPPQQKHFARLIVMARAILGELAGRLPN